MKENEKEYVTPEMEMTEFEAKDVIATSGDEIVHTSRRTWLTADTPFCPING
ncbi:MAG: hypothetical protein IKS03_06890 [Ruminococcus sp.]|nr:hypothetical protein [Ruminococcus sp.]